jgi:replicative DNA helicase
MIAPAFHDPEAEQAVIGACLISRQAAESATRVLVSDDFGAPTHAHVFEAIVGLQRAGAGVDPVTVADALRSRQTDWPGMGADLIHWVNALPSSNSVGRYAEIVARCAAKRGLHALGTELVAKAQDATVDPADLADQARTQLAQLDSPALTSSPGDLDLDAFLAEDEKARPAVIPGLLAEDDRAVVVAPEGVGKSEWARQIVVCASRGVHPMTFRRCEPVPVLLVDLENPRQLVRERLRLLSVTADQQATGERAPATLWLRPGGIDLRKRSDRVALEDVIRRSKPKLVSLGPVYKAYTRKASESDEQVAAEVQAVLDDLRTRYRFALVLEHHAPQASNGVRDLRPFGSSLWLRWPEYGLRLTPDREHADVLKVGRWRGDRSPAQWPDELHRGDVWPWVGHWLKGLPSASDDGRLVGVRGEWPRAVLRVVSGGKERVGDLVHAGEELQ